jgi:AsmA protein
MSIPRWGKVLLIVVAVLVIIALALPYVLDVERYKPQIVAAIEKETGRKASIGKMRARFLPSVGFTIEDVVLGSPASFGEHPLLEVGTIRGSLAWGPLLSRQFQLSGIELVRPKVQIIEDEAGKNNYEFPARPAAPGGRSALEFKLADIDSIEITEAQIVLAQVAGRKRTLIPSIHASNVNAELSDVALDAAKIKQWRGEANLKGVQVQLPGLAPLEFGSGEMTLAKGAVDAHFKTSVGKAADITGKIRVDNLDKGLAKFELSMPVLDLGQLASAGAKTSPTAAAGSAPQKSELIAQGRITAERVRYAPFEGTAARVDARIFTDRVEIWPVSLNFYDGTVSLSGRVDRRQAPERFSANLEARNVDIGKLMSAMPDVKQKVTGSGEVTLQLFGALSARLMDSLTGSGNFALRDGKLPGLNMSGTLQSLAKVQKFLTFGAGSAEKLAGETPFNSITGDLNVGGGRVRSERIHLDSPTGTVDLRGSFGFDETLDYDGQAVLMGGQSGAPADNPIGAITGILGKVSKQTIGRISVPFSVKGTFSNPKVGPGRGIPGISVGSSGTSTTQTTDQTQQQPQKKKSIFDIFRKPPQ